MRTWCGVVVLAVAVFVGSTPVFAQATRTWISGVGDDVNPCSRTAPCKTWAGAISKTAAGGEIDALDPGGFGSLTITKSITLDGTGGVVSTLVAGTNGIVVNAGATDIVALRHIAINGIAKTGSGGLNGIRFLGGAELHVEECEIFGFNNFGIDASTSANAKLFVSNTTIRNAAAGGISLTPSAGTLQASLGDNRLHGNGFGVHAKGNVVASVYGGDAAGNTGDGFWAETSPAEINLTDVRATGNDTGVHASDNGLVRTTSLTVTGNATNGLLAETGGQIIPFAGNLIAGNPAGGTTCQGDAAATAVICPSSVDPQPVCEAPVCQAPVVQSTIGPCKKCRTKAGVTTCTSCNVSTE